ncbi:MAG: hypothetical protein JO371_01585 [Paraburkholderia sp.]|nr:hypothetical protein [Paraburkholderia sp.]
MRAVTLAASAAFTFALSGTGAVHAAPSDAAASAVGAASGAAVVESDAQYTVHPGQSLNDVAIALTQSHDHAILARAAKALFDANPNAFMGHDPSRLKLGAVLNVPSLDSLGSPASGVAGASAATASSAPVAATTAPPAAASAVVAATPATASQPVSAGTMAASVASAPITASAAAAVSSGAASGPSQAAESAQQPGTTASDVHAWSGAIQPAGSAPVSGGASQSSQPVAAAPAAAQQPASRVNAPVSSLQQLLALKNRVLMELQKHGIGPTVRAPDAGSGVAAQPAPVQAAQTASASAVPGATAAASAAVGTQPVGAAGTTEDAGATGLSQTMIAGIAGGIVVLLALIMSLLVRRRRSRVADDHATNDGLGESDRNSGADRAASAAPTPGAAQNDVPSEATPVGGRETPAASTGTAGLASAAESGAETLPAKHLDAAAEEDDDEGVQYIGSGSHVDPASQVEAPSAGIPGVPYTAAGHEEPLQHTAHDTFPLDPAQPEPLPPSAEQLLDEHRPEATSEAESHGEPEALAQPYEPERRLNFGVDEPAGGSFANESSEFPEPPPLTEPLSEDLNPATLEALHGNVPLPPVPPLDFAEPPGIPQVGLPRPAEFPREAVDALGSLDMPLPPRSEPSMPFDEPPASLATQPPVAPEINAKPPIVPPPESVDDAEEIAAGTPGTPGVARLGAMPFGSLKLDFDLELPPSPAQALPAFTKEDIAKIARNKLELASEYIELGDLSGARVLINEVIESNDAGTRNEARALLSTLAPLS